MKNKGHKRFAIILAGTLIILLATTGLYSLGGENLKTTSTDPTLAITAQTDKKVYLLRQKILVRGNITLNGLPTSNLVVPVQINDPKGTPVAFRTLQIGTPTQTWTITITDVFLQDLGLNPINTLKMGSTFMVGISLYNPQLTARNVYGTITVFDANMVPMATKYFAATSNPGQTTTQRYSFEVPKWACAGRALIVGNVYSNEPRSGGIALSLEKTVYYELSKTQQGLIQYPSFPPPPPQTTIGTYNVSITLPPYPQAGTYTVYVLGQATPNITSLASTTFNVQNSSGYPPQSSFVYTPTKIYVNMTVSFDPSFSTPEGVNSTIQKYKWDFGDGTPTYPYSYATHNYLKAGEFVVTLNVTDNQSLWSVASKPIIIYPEFGPTANFTWTPTVQYELQNVTFDASSSTPGWYAKNQSFAPIQNYTWNFGDGSGNTATTRKTINHMFGLKGNYTVSLTVTDKVGRLNSVSHVVMILNATTSPKVYDENKDGKINLVDVFATALAFGSVGPDYYYPGSPASPNWNPACDFNHDGTVNLKDYLGVALHFGQDP